MSSAGYVDNILLNENGINYCVVLGNQGEPGLLVRLNNEPKKYIVCRMLEDNSWVNGYYFDDFADAYDLYMRLCNE